MDDLLLFADSKDFLRDAHQHIRGFVEGNLKLNLKSEATVLAPVSEGIPFLGMRLWPQVIRLDGAGKRRLIRAIRTGAQGMASGQYEEDDLAASMRSRLGHAAHANTLGLRRSLINLMDFGLGYYGLQPGESRRLMEQRRQERPFC